jgi:transcriptional regulator with XRE-family HTH domain
MHLHRIHKKRLADALGVTPEYVSMVLNGRREPPDAERKFREALVRIIASLEPSA